MSLRPAAVFLFAALLLGAAIAVAQSTPVPEIVSVEPRTVPPGGQIRIVARNFEWQDRAICYSSVPQDDTCIPIQLDDHHTGTLPVVPNFRSGYVYLKQGLGEARVSSDRFPLDAAPIVRLVPAARNMAAGACMQIDSTLLGSAPALLRWSSNLGTVGAGGRLCVPPGTGCPTCFVRVEACVDGSQHCGTAIVGVLPITSLPEHPVAPPGQEIRLPLASAEAVHGAPVKALSGNGAVTPAGGFTRGGSELDQGLSLVQVQPPGMEPHVVELLPGPHTPGAISFGARHFDQIRQPGSDHQWPISVGAHGDGVTVSGNLLFVHSGPTPESGAMLGYENILGIGWIDTWDVSDPYAPRWLSAISSIRSGGRMWVHGGRLYDSIGDQKFGPLLAVYRITATGLEWESLVPLPPIDAGANVTETWLGDSLFRASGIDLYHTKPLTIEQWARGSSMKLELSAALEEPAPLRTVHSIGANDDFLVVAVSLFPIDIDYERLRVYDRRSNPPVYLGELLANRITTPVFLPGLLVAGQSVFRLVPGQLPERIAEIPYLQPFDWDPSTLRVLGSTTGQNPNLTIVDLSDPLNPKVTEGSRAVLGRDYSARFLPGRGFAVFSASNLGFEIHQLPSRPNITSIDNFGGFGGLWDFELRWPYAYLAEDPVTIRDRNDHAVLKIFDLDQPEPTLVATVDELDVAGLNVEFQDQRMFFATTDSLSLYDNRNPRSPQLISRLPIPADSIVPYGNLVYVLSGDRTGTWVEIADYTAPSSPRVVGRLAPGYNPDKIIRCGSYLLAVRLGAIEVFSLANPLNPVHVHTQPLDVIDIEVRGDIVAANTQKNLILYRLEASGALRREGFLQVISARSFGALTFLNFDERGLLWIGTNFHGGTIFGVDTRNPAGPTLIWERRFARIVGIAETGMHRVVGGHLFFHIAEALAEWVRFKGRNIYWARIEAPVNVLLRDVELTASQLPPYAVNGASAPQLSTSASPDASPATPATTTTGAEPACSGRLTCREHARRTNRPMTLFGRPTPLRSKPSTTSTPALLSTPLSPPPSAPPLPTPMPIPPPVPNFPNK